MYKMHIPIRSGKTASDLLVDGKITPQQFGCYHLLQRESTWGYVSKTNPKYLNYWMNLFQASRNTFNTIIDSLVDAGLILRMPNPKKERTVFLVFEECLSTEEIEHYLEILAENPEWKKVTNKSELFLWADADIPSETPTEDSEPDIEPVTVSKEPQPKPKFRWRPPIEHGDGILWSCSEAGLFSKKKDGMSFSVLNVEDVPEPIKQYFMAS